MKKIQTSLLIFLVSLTALWLLADTPLPSPLTYGAFRNVFMQYSGVIAMGAMSLAMILALRWQRLESMLGGLDKIYRLHKWLGITALVTSILHWWLGQGTKWMTQWGWLVRPPRGARPNPADLGLIEGWLRSQRGLAETLGEWGFYLAALLLVLALIKRFPYHLFRRTHTWLAALYLVFVFHAIVLTRLTYWQQPLGWIMAILMTGGVVAAIIALTGKIGASRKIGARVNARRDLPALRVFEVELTLDPGWPGHTAGQFAFVTFDPAEGPHPYTIASAWNPAQPRLAIAAKALGDHTERLREDLTVGATAVVEGPYGRFDFNDGQARQIWVGAGIGITPFLARLGELAARRGNQAIDLFYSTSLKDATVVAQLTEAANRASVSLHIIDSGNEGRLDATIIRTRVPEWAASSLWFCGPSAFARSLRHELLTLGLPANRFHQELFEMR
ncbi:ferredoxin reductase family protein [Propionivibrio dicarboxylicus]|uniref:Predicted ferric reductase n=1 Tax=Propionivibrio dicarboxylicus TaxID=83767 RepID=A0A1G8KXI1_9RHOO|nr:ferric reductase-like transmembrane domain-containing protein [Propionivibrio dicarboxylicus]SDI48063.1 Predicted ferric reductase [Propionivibrio dicarboxylicus]